MSDKAQPVLLSGDNPQIAKGEGEAVVQAYIAAVPGWKQAVCRRLDAIVTEQVPGVRKAVKWNTPFYGAPGGPPSTWFLGYHCYANYVKVSWFRGTSLDPVPPGASKQAEVRYLDLREGALDEVLFAEWVRQASLLPGEKL